MKLFQNWFSRIGLLGSTIVSTSLVVTIPAQAIPVPQVVAKLQNIVVYLITDDQGVVLHGTNTGNGNQNPRTSTGVFFSSKDAQSFIDSGIKPTQPEISKIVKVTPVSLGEIYRRQQANKNKPQEMNYVYVPTVRAANAALAILNQNGNKVERVTSSPVFIATIISASGKEDYLTFNRDNQNIVPLFFSKEALQSTVRKVYPALGAKSKIQVVELNNLLGYMTDTSDPVAQIFEFNPNTDAK